MDTVMLFIRLVLFAVFAVAGVGKLLDLKGSVAAVEDFGVPSPWSRPIGYGLPLLEVALAVALIPTAAAPWAAAAGSLLMAIFALAIGINLVHGRRPDCHCFGKLHSAPIGWQTLVRNSVIGLAALTVVLAGPGAGLTTWLSDLDSQGRVLTGLLMAALAVLGWQSWSMRGLSLATAELESRVNMIDDLINGQDGNKAPGLPVKSIAPSFRLQAIDKGVVTLDGLRKLGNPVLLVFADPACSVCNKLMPRLGRWATDRRTTVTVAVISSGTEEENRKKIDRYGLEWVLLQEAREVAMPYRVPGAPAAVLISPEGVVTSEMVFGMDPILGLLTELAEAQSEPIASPRPTIQANHRLGDLSRVSVAE